MLRKRQKRQRGQPDQRACARAEALDTGAYASSIDAQSAVESAPSPARAAGERAIMNTAYRSAGEIIGRLASLLLFAQVGHSLGQNGLGAFVFAVVFTSLVMVAVNLGLDRYILRAIATERSAAHTLFFNVIALKLLIAVPLFGLSFLGLHFVGAPSRQAELTSWVLAPGVFCDSLARTQLAVFAAHERNGPPAAADTVNRLLSAALGITALRLGYGVVSVGVTYSIGSASAVVIAHLLMRRTIGVPARSLSYRSFSALASRSLPFAVQDLFTTMLARVDTLILSVLATQAAVGRYGAAYRLFESTIFISTALVGAFAAMYTYLGPDSSPPLRSVYQRSIKLAVVLLMPLAVPFIVLARPICRLIYGPAFGAAALPLRILGPGVVLLGVVVLTTTLLVSRGDPRRIASLWGIMVAINVALNLILIPLFGVAGAASAMLATEVIFAASIGRRALHEVGRLEWRSVWVGPLTAAAAMTAVAVPLHAHLAAALVAGVFAYLAVLVPVDWLVSPRDVMFVTGMLRRRLSSHSSLHWRA